MLNLTKKSTHWVVSHLVNNNIVHQKCQTIEDAADVLNKIGVQDEQIDKALCQIYAYEMPKAIFDQYGDFISVELE